MTDMSDKRISAMAAERLSEKKGIHYNDALVEIIAFESALIEDLCEETKTPNCSKLSLGVDAEFTEALKNIDADTIAAKMGEFSPLYDIKNNDDAKSVFLQLLDSAIAVNLSVRNRMKETAKTRNRLREQWNSPESSD